MSAPPPADGAPSADTLRVLVARAGQLAELRRWDDLLAVTADILAQDPRHPRAFGWIAQAELERGGAGSAERALAADAYVALRPEHEWGHRLRSVALLRHRRRVRDAELAAREAVRVEPDVPEAHGQLAQALLARRRARDAQDPADTRARLAPADPASYVLLADVAAARRRYADAERHAREALRLAPNDPAAQSALAEALGARGRTREAMQAAYDAARAAPSGAASRLLLGTFVDHQNRRAVHVIVGLFVVFVLGAVPTSQVPLPARRWVLVPLLLVTFGGMIVVPALMAWRARRRTPPEVRRAAQAIDPRGEWAARLAGSVVTGLVPFVLLVRAVAMWSNSSERPGPMGALVYLAVVAVWAVVARATARSFRRLNERTGR